MLSPTVMTGWASRIIDVRTAGSRDSESGDQQVAERLGRQPEQRQPGQARERGVGSRSPPTVPITAATIAVETVAIITGRPASSGLDPRAG
jgi:hypothetical protein